MSVHLKSQGVIELSGRCGADDAEVLQHHLLAMSGATVEWSDCEHLHSAVLQVLLVGAPLMRGAPKNAFLATHIAPILARLVKQPLRAGEARVTRAPHVTRTEEDQVP